MNAHPVLKPYGAPHGVDPMEWRKSVEARLNDLLDRAMSLITALDMMEVDVDLEDDEVEEENEHGGDILDEPHDDQGELEPGGEDDSDGLRFSGVGVREARDLLHKHGLVKMRRNVVFIE